MTAPPIAGVPDPQAVSPVAAAMWVNDTASQALGMELLTVRPGYARLRMTVRREFLNGLGTCHGGFMFLLADSAFAFACNSHNQRAVAASGFACNSHNQRAVAAGAQIEFLAPPKEGDVLIAEAVEQHLAGRTGLYDVSVTDQNGRRVALFRGRSASIRGEHVPGAGT